eukprot:3668929-Rhodomonas_salina.1
MRFSTGRAAIVLSSNASCRIAAHSSTSANRLSAGLDRSSPIAASCKCSAAALGLECRVVIK